MLYYSKRSRQRIAHTKNCFYLRRIKPEDMGEFNTREEARENRYKQCKYCAPIGKYYRREYNAMESYGAANGLSFYLFDGVITIITPHSKWKLITMGKKNRVHLLHKSTVKKETQEFIIPGYHSQSFYSPTLIGYMEFILKHDNHRLHNPSYIPPKPKPAPRKGTKRYKKLQAQKKARKKGRAIKRVLDIIDAECQKGGKTDLRDKEADRSAAAGGCVQRG